MVYLVMPCVGGKFTVVDYIIVRVVLKRFDLFFDILRRLRRKK